MSTGAIIGIVIGVVVLLTVVWGISTYNGFVKMRNRVQEAFSTMDVYLKKRFDLIPNLVETVKGYAAHESETLQKVTEARSAISSADSVEERIAGENMISGALKSLFAVSESYPDLKANANFMELQGQLNTVENDIASSRKYYNAVVREYNTKQEMFPANIIGNMMHLERANMFEVEGEEERRNVNVKF